jgi:uncharacterized membrane protein
MTVEEGMKVIISGGLFSPSDNNEKEVITLPETPDCPEA